MCIVWHTKIIVLYMLVGGDLERWCYLPFHALVTNNFPQFFSEKSWQFYCDSVSCRLVSRWLRLLFNFMVLSIDLELEDMMFSEKRHPILLVWSQFLPSSGNFWWLPLYFLIDRSLILLDYKGSTKQFCEKALLLFHSCSRMEYHLKTCLMTHVLLNWSLFFIFILSDLVQCLESVHPSSSFASLSRYWSSWSDFENWHDGGVPFIFGQVYLGGCYCHKIIRGRGYTTQF